MNLDLTDKNLEIALTAKMLFEKEKTLLLTPERVADNILRGEASLRRDRAEKIGIPYTKLGKGTGSDKVLYSVYDIAKFIVGRKKKVMS
jgi:hypothetical protein